MMKIKAFVVIHVKPYRSTLYDFASDKMSSHERWFMCDICSFSHLSPQIISQHYRTKHSVYKLVEKVIETCEIKDERTILRLQESREIRPKNSVKEKIKKSNSKSSLTVSEMTHWYICNECYVSILYSSQIAIIKHYKDEHGIVITAKQAADECFFNDQEHIKQMIEEGRVEGGFGAGTAANLRLTIKPKTSNNCQIPPSINEKSLNPSGMANSPSFEKKDESIGSIEPKSKWGMNHQQNYTSLINRAARRKFSRNSVSPPPSTISRSASSTKFSPEFFKDDESPDAPISNTSTAHAL